MNDISKLTKCKIKKKKTCFSLTVCPVLPYFKVMSQINFNIVNANIYHVSQKKQAP